MRQRPKFSSHEREDKLLDYIAENKAEITRYLIVALVGEILLFFLDQFIGWAGLAQWFPVLHLFCWGVPFFFAVKLFVLRQKGSDAYEWMMQGMKFVMCFIAILLLIYQFFLGALQTVLAGKTAVQQLLVNLVREILYFVAVYKIIFKRKK